jgi:hypothetical protein
LDLDLEILLASEVQHLQLDQTISASAKARLRFAQQAQQTRQLGESH